MRIQLPDINVLIALHDVTHQSHHIAQQWFFRQSTTGWATCPLTENGFVRIFAQMNYPQASYGVANALYILKHTVQASGTSHQFWSDGVSLSDHSLFQPSAIVGPKQITDVYLLGLCQQNGGTLVTLDARVTVSAIASPAPDLLLLLTP